MSRESGKKIELLEKGAQIIHHKGFNNTGINEILEAARVPKGSFYFYFKSKEEFGLQVIDFLMAGNFITAADHHLAAPGIPYLEKFKNFFDGFLEYFEKNDYIGGCPIGNFALEMADLNKNFRLKLKKALADMTEKVALFLVKAKENGELPPGFDTEATAEFILNSWEGALMRLKVEKSSAPMHLFYKIVFENLLGQESGSG
ncbi:MAG: TetR family transcriptional regulator C-terminal domain-containing protein [Candidatus Aminicenantes bacterium]|jgi:TetR/AcrR family transcriptional repressor of nem operon